MDKSANTAAAAGGGSAQPAIAAQTSHPTLTRESSTSSLRRTDSVPAKHTPLTSGATSAATSTSTSPFASRDSSPNRPPMRSSTSKTPAASGTRSRKNSQPEMSPSRPAKSNIIPTSSSSSSSSTSSLSHRTLSASNTPTLLPATSDATIRAPVPQKSPLPTTDQSRDAPRWPVSPRLRSPPPVLNRPNLGPARKGGDHQDPPTISVQRSTPSPQPPPYAEPPQSDSDLDDSHLQPGMRTPARSTAGTPSTLETVQEASPLGSPQVIDSAMEKLEDSLISDAGSQPEVTEVSAAAKVFKSRANLAPNESGSDSGSVKADRRSGATSAPPALTSRQSSTSTKLNGGRGKAGEGSLQSMTVETETVSSVPQVAVAAVGGGQAANGSLRTNPSVETIRPKKDKKKSSRKQPAVAPGTASTKADIFEAKIANAVDEADTSDSDETFVYDSNPLDHRDRPQRFHSRTPSATSMASQADRNGMRSIHSVLDGPGPSVTVKKNMKFVNNFNGSGNDSGLGDDEGKGSGRSNPGSGRGTARHHIHPGRFSRNAPREGGPPSLFDNESPFPINAARSKFGGNNTNSRQSSGPPSPRFNSARGTANGKQRGGGGGGGVLPPSSAAASYDLDETTGADDERTPLIHHHPSTRSARFPRNHRRHHVSLRSLEQQSYRHPPSLLNRLATCLVVTVMIMLILSGVIGFMFATSQPLDHIQLLNITNVIASEQELMFDIIVQAHNPNVVVVTVDASSMEVFAKSPHAGTDSEWWRKPHGDGTFMASEASDSPPPPSKNDTAPNILLGHIFDFEVPLSFEGSFFHNGLSASTAGCRLKLPGNETAGGSERWERIMEDEFTLLVKGSLKYSLPLSQRVRSALITGKTRVKPNSPNEPIIQPNGTDISIN